MAAENKVNYTESMVQRMLELYAELGNEGLDTIAKELGKPVRSIRSKLVREGAYVASEKPAKAKREDGPTKKELLRDLEALAPHFPIEGFMNATKEALTALIHHLETEVDAPAEDESVAEAA